MGLSMRLTKKHYIGDEERATLKIAGVANLNINRVCSIEEELGCWFKANQIHRWFVENVQGGQDNCKDYYVAPEQLQQLLDTVNAVLANPRKARKLLSTELGAFFGSYDYDASYFEQLEKTRDILTAALEDESCDIEYSSSW